MSEVNNPIVWEPSVYDLTRSPLAKFRNRINKKYKLFLNSYADLHDWSVNPATAGDFWMELFDALDMRATKQPSRAFANEIDVRYSSIAPIGGICGKY